MRRDHAEGLFLVEFQEDGLGDGTTQLRLCARAKLIDEKQGFFIGLLQQGFHINKV